MKHRKQHAYGRLLSAGAAATPALRRGLTADDHQVRVGCLKVLDHTMDEAALPEMIANLDHPEGEVRKWALHALACDRCKEGSCRPGEDDVVPVALRMLAEDRSRRVRSMAVQMVGPSVHRRSDVAPALERARDTDVHPVVRKVAGWWAPGGTLYERHRPRPARTARPRRDTRAMDADTAIRNAHEWFEHNSGWAPPDDDTLAEWIADGVCRCPDECLVAAEGWCEHGLASWALILAALARDPRNPAANHR